MKYLWLLLLLIACHSRVAAQATNLVPAYVGHDRLAPFSGLYAITGQYVPLYLAGDTTNAVLHLVQGERVRVTGVGRRWVQVVHKYKDYSMRRQFVTLPDDLQEIPDSVAVPRDATTGLIRYVGEAAVPGSSQAELMGRAKVWFATNFRTEEVLQVQDAATGALVGKAFSEVFIHAPEPSLHRLDYTIQITCRDGSYRYAISTFGFGAYLGSYSGNTGFAAEKVVFDTRFNGKQRAVIRQYKAELFRVAQQVQQQLRTALDKPVGS
ncbi:DUF4468 domain-containing protein [Hymenobacter sp. UYCo722]|uniref:DUF4468 domain-containing protein n=1 Tax=Hymenobacter sp. UYCo722 TaxID=3156335 RepID=UPI00339096B0